MNTLRLRLVIALIVIVFAAVIALTGLSLRGIWIVSIPIVVFIFALGEVMNSVLVYLRDRNRELDFDLLLMGVYESEIINLQKRVFSLKDHNQKMLREVGVYSDPGKRAQQILELRRTAKEIEKLLVDFPEQLSSIRDLKREVAQTRTQIRHLTEEQKRLRQQTSFIYNARIIVENIAASTDKMQSILHEGT